METIIVFARHIRSKNNRKESENRIKQIQTFIESTFILAKNYVWYIYFTYLFISSWRLIKWKWRMNFFVIFETSLVICYLRFTETDNCNYFRNGIVIIFSKLWYLKSSVSFEPTKNRNNFCTLKTNSKHNIRRQIRNGKLHENIIL